MSESSGRLLWQLDLLEVKFHNAPPRYRNTKRLLGARHNEKFIRKLPAKEDADAVITDLKREVFGKKYHACVKKLYREVKKLVKPGSDDLSPEILEKLVISRTIKAITNALLTTKQLKENPPNYIPEEIRAIITDKNHLSHPSGFFNTYCKNDNLRNKQVSNMFNKKGVKETMVDMEWTFKVVRGNLTKEEKLNHQKLKSGKNSSAKETEAESADDDEVDNRIASGSDDDSENENESEATLKPLRTQSQSASESDLDLDSDSEAPDESKHNLPQLATGYFSGGSDDEDDDIDEDEVVKSVTEQRKNRRGQRARQKIWAQKYGKDAKHVKEERTRLASEREQRQLEYEERERKRQLKRKAEPTGSNNQPLGDRSNNTAATEEKLHPSWQAKKLAEKSITAKFSGKKIKFD